MVKKSILVILVLVVCSGAAAAQTYSIRGYTYEPLWEVCRENGIEFGWDSFGRVATLKKNGVEAKLRVGSDKILVNDKITDIGPPVRFHKGAVVIPRTFSRNKISQIFGIPVYKSRSTSHLARSITTNRIKKIVIDPGHGGKDPGALGRYGLMEKDVVLDIAKKLKYLLASEGIKVVMTRSTDVFIPLWRRSDIANKEKADLFISVHANAFRKRWVRGFEAYLLAEATDDIARAVEAAENNAIKLEKNTINRYSSDAEAIVCDLILDQDKKNSSKLAGYICKSAKKKLYVKDRGVKGARFYVLKNTQVPAVLVEVGFISNTKEEKLLKSDSYKDKIARAIASGILSYKDEYEGTNGFTR